MESPNRLSHRRRSHSASSPIPRRQPDDVKWRISAKRSRPSSIRSPSYKDLAHGQPAEKWDVDQWRRGKRARRDSNAAASSDEPFGIGSDPVFPAESTTSFTFASSSTAPLASTSAAFQFFPQKKARRSRFSREPSPREVGRISPDEARRMRADALGELHRSVVESGEGLVRKMRDWESRSARPAADTHQPRRSWRRLASYYGTPHAAEAVSEQPEEDEDDIFVVGETSSFPAAHSGAQKKRSLSMDVDLPEIEAYSSPFAGLDSCDRSSSPIAPSSGPSAYSSDDEGHADMDVELASSASGPFSSPALSHTYSTSANSSLVSLPLFAHTSERSADMGAALPTSATITSSEFTAPALGSPPSTCSEKAIAALALAMANGAVGISDYEALRAGEGLTTLEETHAGELWS
ncbi:uncharacterized protein TRAVEDRAFT_62246 [Trametes versicolor FP-101664 SS1]|uniref:uncharacterized protein n=1 Tax=Trametes versicolor (strain FP-101664) TaxID=717944 RepID=UPI00046246CC|nr:uncharacterized protein TRAVEDRAFT_62246 [Trametes versicolor FP-101664 SS1]EIW64806.1 hypothetical protein TRAVEDRAFT_62246 [Trametes versicolor FP-101664 SS1]